MKYEIINKEKKIINVELNGITKKGTEFEWKEIKYKVQEIIIKNPNSLIQLICKEKTNKRSFVGSKKRTTI